MNKKRAELTSSVLISIILAIAGFIIVFLVYSQINWTGNVNKEVCHESVVYRATLPSFAGAKEYVPLKCKTDKICITAGNGKCKEFENTKGVTKIKVSNKEQIEKAVAGEIVSCWETMGEGKLSLFSQWFAGTYGFSKVLSSCVICSRIAFDNENLEKAGINLKNVDVMSYMMKHEIPGKGKSYYAYLSGERGKISIKENDLEKIIESISIEKTSESEIQNEKKGSEELGILFMQVSAPKYKDVFRNTIYTLLGGYGGSFVIAPVATTKLTLSAAKLAVAHPIGAAVVAIIGLSLGAYQANTVFNNNAIAAGYCGDVSIGEEAETGCSVVRTVDYNSEDLSKYCSVIESIP